MRELRVVGPGEDSGHILVESVDGDEQFSLSLGKELRTVSGSDMTPPEDETPAIGLIEAQLPAADEAPSAQVGPKLSAVPPVPSLPPREIQVRVRGGESAESIAESSGMTLEKVLRFARPVLEERARITVEARRARARRSTAEGQLVEFGEAVDSRFAAHGIEAGSVSWDAYRRDDSVWVVSAGWVGGDSERIARWAVSLSHRLVTPLDETASDLLSDRPIRPVVHAVPTLVDVADGDTGPLPEAVPEQVFDQEAEADTDRYGDTPPLPLRLADPPRRSGRQQIPAWDDILLGVRRKTD
jgi:hypothetical protein